MKVQVCGGKEPLFQPVQEVAPRGVPVGSDDWLLGCWAHISDAGLQEACRSYRAGPNAVWIRERVRQLRQVRRSKSAGIETIEVGRGE